jgi:hypothetical protein
MAANFARLHKESMCSSHPRPPRQPEATGRGSEKVCMKALASKAKRLDALTLAPTGSFRRAKGDALPW